MNIKKRKETLGKFPSVSPFFSAQLLHHFYINAIFQPLYHNF